MDQQDSSGISTQQGSGAVTNLSNRTLGDIRTGISIIAWFAMYSTFYSLTRTLIGLMDTNYSMGEWARFMVAVAVAVLLSFFILSVARGAQD